MAHIHAVAPKRANSHKYIYICKYVYVCMYKYLRTCIYVYSISRSWRINALILRIICCAFVYKGM